MDFATITNTGSRSINEDSHLVLNNNNIWLFVVADGLGGHGRGEVASEIVTKTFKVMFNNINNIGTDNFIPAAITEAQSLLLQEQKLNNAPKDLKTTCVAALISDNICKIGYIGDSRVYVFSKNKIMRRTIDHSVPQMLAIAGDIKEKQIRHHPKRNLLLRVLGDVWDSPGYDLLDDIDVTTCQALLLCTDGLWELCEDNKMCKYLKKSDTAKQWLDCMTNEVEKNGKSKDMDNYTAIAVKMR